MKKFFLIFFFIFSFVYMNYIQKAIDNNSPLMQEIKDNAYLYEKESIDAIIEGPYIIPGLNGIKIDYYKSFKKMKKKNIFLKSEYVLYEYTPNVSVSDYNLIIKKANKIKNAVSILSSNKNIYENEITNIYEYDDICIVNFSKCDNNKVEYTYVINNNNFYNIDVAPGDIIYITDDFSSLNYKYFRKNIYSKNLKIIKLDKLISECYYC